MNNNIVRPSRNTLTIIIIPYFVAFCRYAGYPEEATSRIFRL